MREREQQNVVAVASVVLVEAVADAADARIGVARGGRLRRQSVEERELRAVRRQVEGARVVADDALVAAQPDVVQLDQPRIALDEVQVRPPRRR